MDMIISILEAYARFGPTTRSIVKTILRYLTSKCELERICERNPGGDESRYGYRQCHALEQALYRSKNESLRAILVANKMKIKTAMETMLRAKRLAPEKCPTLLNCMPHMLRKIISYNALLGTAEDLRATKYDESDAEHEDMLMCLWTAIKGEDDKLPDRHTKRWGEIGFQGTNPATDFRGMGLLSLSNLLYMFNEHRAVAMKVYGQSEHPQYGFSFAIVGINFTGTAFELLRNGKLKGWMYNIDDNNGDFNLEHFQRFFVEIFEEFAEYWVMRKPDNIMLFNEVKKDYMVEVEKRLNAGKWNKD